jgi:iron complex transport system substrate-binding protein
VIKNGARPRPRAAATVAATAALALALAACGGSGEATTDAASSSSAATETTVATAFGDVTVPAEPERVITLAESALDVALGVGITPVGTTASRGGDAPPAYLGEDAAAIPVVGTVREANLEAVLETGPDLILAASGLPQEQYDALSAIAPTVVPDAPATGEWAEPLHLYAEALGKDDELTDRLDAVTARAEELAGAGALDGTAAVVRWMANGPVIMNANNMPGMLLQTAGAEPVQAAVDLAAAPHSDPLSLENLGEVDADRLFLAAFGADGASALEAAQTEPAFTRLKAAGSGATTSVDGGVWSSSSGPIAAEQVMDDIEAAVS